MNIVDYSPEIQKNLNRICFPTFPGHSGCILLDVDILMFFRMASDTEKDSATYFNRLMGW